MNNLLKTLQASGLSQKTVKEQVDDLQKVTTKCVITYPDSIAGITHNK
jgi:hypothetical protein